jgi:hypothetical protein
MSEDFSVRFCELKWADSWHQGSLHNCVRDKGHEGPCYCRCGQEYLAASQPQEIAA